MKSKIFVIALLAVAVATSACRREHEEEADGLGAKSLIKSEQVAR